MRAETPLERLVRTAFVVTLVLLGLLVTVQRVVTWQVQAADAATRRVQLQMSARRCGLGQRLQTEQRASGLIVARCVVQAVQP